MKKFYYVLAGITCACVLTGCNKVTDLTAEQNNQVAEYAAGILISRTELSNGTYSKETETEETTSNKETKPQDETQNQEETTTTAPDILDCADALKISPLIIRYNSYLVTDEYPDDSDAMFTFSADKGYKLLIIKMQLENNSTQAVTVNTHTSKPVFKISVNMDKKYNNYGNLLLNDLSNLKDFTVDASSQKEILLVFMIEEKDAAGISSMNLSCNAGGKELTIK